MSRVYLFVRQPSRISRAMLAAFVVTFVFLLSVASSRAEQVRIAYSAISGAMAPLWIAHDDGLFQRQGIQAQLLYIGGGSVVTQALLGGDVQFVRWAPMPSCKPRCGEPA